MSLYIPGHRHPWATIRCETLKVDNDALFCRDVAILGNLVVEGNTTFAEGSIPVNSIEPGLPNQIIRTVGGFATWDDESPGAGNIYTTDGTLSSDRVVDLDGWMLSFINGTIDFPLGSLPESDISPGLNNQVLTTIGGVTSWSDSQNIYTQNGTLSGDRLVDLDNNSFRIFSNEFSFEINPTAFSFTPNPGQGFVYTDGNILTGYANVDVGDGAGQRASAIYNDPLLGITNIIECKNTESRIANVTVAGANEVFTVSNELNSYGGQGYTRFVSDEVRLENLPVQNNLEDSLLVRNVVSGAIEYREVSSLPTGTDTNIANTDLIQDATRTLDGAGFDLIFTLQNLIRFGAPLYYPSAILDNTDTRLLSIDPITSLISYREVSSLPDSNTNLGNTDLVQSANRIYDCNGFTLDFNNASDITLDSPLVFPSVPLNNSNTRLLTVDSVSGAVEYRDVSSIKATIPRAFYTHTALQTVTAGSEDPILFQTAPVDSIPLGYAAGIFTLPEGTYQVLAKLTFSVGASVTFSGLAELMFDGVIQDQSQYFHSSGAIMVAKDANLVVQAIVVSTGIETLQIDFTATTIDFDFDAGRSSITFMQLD